MKIKLSKNQWEEVGRKAGWIKESQFMSSYEYLDIGSTPSGEDCAQLGSTKYDYYSLSMMELKAYANQLKRIFTDMPSGLSIVKKSNAHDFGTYYELNFKWVDGDRQSERYAYEAEGRLPEYWDEAAKSELTSKGYFVELEKGKSEKKENEEDDYYK